MRRLGEETMAIPRAPVMSWLQPEARSLFAVGSESGLRVYRLAAGFEESGGEARFEMVGFRPQRHAVTSLGSRTAGALDQACAVAVGNAVGEVGLQFYAPSDDGTADSSRAGSTVAVYGASERASRVLEFNSAHSSLLACGFEHREGQASLFIRDITQGVDVRQLLGSNLASGSEPAAAAGRHSRNASASLDQAAALAAASGGVTSVSWVPGSADDILVASRRKRSTIRLFDLRDRGSSSTVLHLAAGSGETSTAAGTVYDLQFDPFCSVRYMAHDGRGTANLWDIRWALRPVHTLDMGSSTARVRYSPRRRGQIAAAARDGGVVRVFSVHEYADGKEAQVAAGVAARRTARSILEEARARDRYDEDRAVQQGQAPPDGLRVWAEGAATARGPPVADFLWVPALATDASLCQHQLVTCSRNGTLTGRALPMARVAALSCRGDVAVLGRWGEVRELTSARDRLGRRGSEVNDETNDEIRGEIRGATPGLASFAPQPLAPDVPDMLAGMRHRALREFGADAGRNALLVDDTAARDMWLWVRDGDIRHSTGAYSVAYGVDCSFMGVYDVMRLRKRQMAHLHALAPNEAARVAAAARSDRAGHTTRLAAQRQLALGFVGWGLDGPIREQHIRTLEAAQQFAMAAGASLVYGDHWRCLQSLELSPAQDQKLLSFMLKKQLLADAAVSEDTRARPFAGSAEAMPEDMFACPHLQMIFAYLFTGSWHAVVQSVAALPLSWRLAVALRYFDDAALLRYLETAGRIAVRRGSLDGLLVTGIRGAGRVLMQNYVDATADVQTAALVTMFGPADAIDDPAEHWIYAYRHLLNMWRMFTIRCHFDVAHASHRAARGLPRISQVAAEIAVRPADVRCQFCHQSVAAAAPAAPASASAPAAAAAGAASAAAPAATSAPTTRLLNTHCPRCLNLLPRCIVCRMTLGAAAGSPASTSAAASNARAPADVSQWFSWCQTCGHGGHAAHLHTWFATHTECPVPGCVCNCERNY
ncbi:hypothetical protein H4R26_003922 [Coemansia thaxteri]|uniref:GATOR2 complex protein MIO zinc-ribbon like domain-containing protein n=1 Tax=Coemansia thaxteri TaxID=2663907 RepID=A0A9W8BFV5_9FUNG|nr:hypothetical protein H4R26_003922 [Coemansia thaxteri]